MQHGADLEGINPALSLPPYYRKIHFVTLPSHLHPRGVRCPPLRLPNQNFVCMSHLRYVKRTAPISYSRI